MLQSRVLGGLVYQSGPPVCRDVLPYQILPGICWLLLKFNEVLYAWLVGRILANRHFAWENQLLPL